MKLISVLLATLLTLTRASSDPPETPAGWQPMPLDTYCRASDGSPDRSEVVCGGDKPVCGVEACTQQCKERDGCKGVEFNYDGEAKGTCKLKLVGERQVVDTSGDGVACYGSSDPGTNSSSAAAQWTTYNGWCTFPMGSDMESYARIYNTANEHCKQQCPSKSSCKS